MFDPLLSLPGYALRRAAAAMIAELSERLAEIGLRHTDASTLILIEANPGVTASALGRMLDIKRANMVPLIARLVATGLIERQPLDGKSHALGLTATGHERLGEAWGIIDSFEAELLERVPAAHRDHLVPALNALWRSA
jgi:DNA-binding MarR family transcriptional regulator